MTAPLSPSTLRGPPAQIIARAVEMSTCSPCRSKRGVVVFDGARVVSVGYNFKPGFACDGSEACKATCRIEAVHAEQMALIYCGRDKALRADLLHVKTIAGVLVASGGPSCVECSKLALAVGIAGVWLYHAGGWRRYDMDEFHRLSIAHVRQEVVTRAQQDAEQTIAALRVQCDALYGQALVEAEQEIAALRQQIAAVRAGEA